MSVVTRLRSRLEGPNTYGNSKEFWIAFIVAASAFTVYPLLTDPYTVLQSSRYFTLGFLALSLCLVWGYAGVLSFGQVAFFGAAAYMFGIIGINFSSALGVTAAAVGAVVVGMLFAAILGYFMFYGGVRDVYVTILTLVVALVLNTFMAQTAGSEWAVGEAQLGGFNGMTGIPDFTLGIGDVSIVFSQVSFYYLVLFTLLGTYLGLRVLVNSNFGMTMVAVREDEERTATFGYNVPYIKLVVFTIGGGLAALGGVLWVSWGNYVDPAVFGIAFAALPVVWVTIGGRESLIGPLVATFAIERMQTSLSGGIGPLGPEWAMVIVGGLLLGVVLFLPSGAAPAVNDLVGQIRKQRAGQSQSTPTEEVVK